MASLIEEEVSAPVATEAVSTEASTPVDNVSSNWIDTLPEEFRGEGSINRHGSMDELLNSYKHGQSMLGRKNGIPDFENDSPEVISAFREQLGVPSDVADYKIQTPEGFQSDESYEAFTGLLHKGNVPNDVADSIYQMGAQQTQQALENAEAERGAQIDIVNKEFESSAGYQELAQGAQSMLDTIDPSGDIVSQEDLSKLGEFRPTFMKLLNQMNKLTANDSVIKATAASTQGGYEERFSSIMDDVASGRISKESGNARISQLTNASFPDR
jgi:hypothetical protein